MAIEQTSTIDRSAPEASNPATALWRIAVANYEAAKIAFAKADERLSAVNEAYRAAVPNRADEFSAYSLHRYRDADLPRTTLVHKTEMAVAMRDYRGRSELTDDEFAAINVKAVALVNDFLAWLAFDKEESDRIYGDEQERFDEACDRLSDARDELLDAPAPDADALFYKLDVIVPYLKEVDSDDAERFAALASDIRRLLGKAE
jgi:hypothetical protein